MEVRTEERQPGSAQEGGGITALGLSVSKQRKLPGIIARTEEKMPKLACFLPSDLIVYLLLAKSTEQPMDKGVHGHSPFA